MGITMTTTDAWGNLSVLLFYPEGRTYSPPARRAGGGIPPGGRAVRSARRIALSSESARQCRRACGRRSSLPVRLSEGSSPGLQLCRKLLSSVGTTCHPPAKTCHSTRHALRVRQLCRSYGRCYLAPSIFFCRAKRNKTAPCREQKGRERLWRSITWKRRS